jgi:hypothetical protein
MDLALNNFLKVWGPILVVFFLPAQAYASCLVPVFDTFEQQNWTVGEPQHYDNTKYGFAFPFHGRSAKGTFYIYDFEVVNPNQEDAEKQLSQAVYEIDYLTKKLSSDTRLSDPYLVPKEYYSGSDFIENAVYLVMSTDGTHAVTIASMGLLHGCFHKLRYTHSIKSIEPVDIADGFKGFSVLINAMQTALQKTDYIR